MNHNGSQWVTMNHESCIFTCMNASMVLVTCDSNNGSPFPLEKSRRQVARACTILSRNQSSSMQTVNNTRGEFDAPDSVK
mmetsp:Transcript_10132/g.21357  ORF Transcript_10132/g.21357 Transcript_10132/m.21357 type:complete len:80 (+) Transcript_10132:235-474(+)